jgi:hypothetical protein
MTALSLWQQMRLGLSPQGRRRPPVPRQIQGLAFWYDAERSSYAGGTWGDRSGNSNPATQASAGLRPVRQLDAAGRWCLRFDGTDDHLAVTTPPDHTAGDGFTVFAVFRVRQFTASERIVSAAATATTDHVSFWTLQEGASAGLTRFHAKSGAANTIDITQVDDGAMVMALLSHEESTGAAEYRDHDSAPADTSTVTAMGTPDLLLIGARAAASPDAHAAIDVYEVGMYARLLSVAERDKLQGYLEARHAPDAGVMAEIDLTAAGFDLADYPDYQFARASAAWRFDAATGLITAYSSGELRVIEGFGALLEPLRENRSKQADDLSGGFPWVAQGVCTVTKVGDWSEVRDLGDIGVDSLFQSVTGFPGGGVRVEPSFLIRKVSASGTLKLVNTNSGSTGGDWDVDLSSVGSGIERITRDHPAVTINFEFVATGGGASGIFFYDPAAGPLDVDIRAVQLEQGTFSTSPILTTATELTRLADELTLPAPNQALSKIGLEMGFQLAISPAGLTTGLRLFGSDATGGNKEIRTLGAAAWAWTPGPSAKGGELEVDAADLALLTDHILGFSLTNAAQVAVLDAVTQLDDTQALTLAHSDVELQLGFYDGASVPMTLASFSYWIRDVVRSRIGA